MRGLTAKTPERLAEARRLREEGLLLREIAERLDVAKATVYDWLSDPDGSRARARKEQYRGVCMDCGGPTTGSEGRGPNAPIRCKKCNEVVQGEMGAARELQRVEQRRARIVELWADGRSLREIASTLGTTKDSLAKTFVLMRRSGYDLPFRRSPADIAAIRAGIAAAALATKERSTDGE